MALADIEKKYDLMNEACELLQEKLQDDCLDALIENFDNLLNDGKVHVEDGIPDEKTASHPVAVCCRALCSLSGPDIRWRCLLE